MFFGDDRKPKGYNGERKAKDMAEWINKKLTATKKEIEPGLEDVKHLYDDTWEKELLTESKPSLVMFYAPWCGHCKSFKPILGKIANKLKDKILFAMVDATDETDIAELHEIQGYPTIKWFPEGEKSDKLSWKLEGGRTEEELEQQIESSLLRGRQKPREWDEIHDEDSFNKLCNDIKGICVVLSGSKNKKDHMYEMIKEMLLKETQGIPMFFSWVIADKQPSLSKYLDCEIEEDKVKTVM